MYSLHIIDKLSSSNSGPNVKETTESEKSEEEKVCAETWNDLFIKKGGLRLLYDIMMSGEYISRSFQAFISTSWFLSCTKK